MWLLSWEEDEEVQETLLSEFSYVVEFIRNHKLLAFECRYVGEYGEASEPF